MLKKDPHPDYPTEEGCYLRGNDYSPVVVTRRAEKNLKTEQTHSYGNV